MIFNGGEMVLPKNMSDKSSFSLNFEFGNSFCFIVCLPLFVFDLVLKSKLISTGNTMSFSGVVFSFLMIFLSSPSTCKFYFN